MFALFVVGFNHFFRQNPREREIQLSKMHNKIFEMSLKSLQNFAEKNRGREREKEKISINI